MFRAVRCAQLSGSYTWQVLSPEGQPVCECASLTWASLIAASLNREIVIGEELATIKRALTAIEQSRSC